MHEMTIAQNMLDLINQSAKDQKFKNVKKVFLEIGVFASIENEALRFCFDIVTNNTIAQNAKLIINTVNGSGCCMKCKEPVSLATDVTNCPKCGSYQIQINSGQELKIIELEVDDSATNNYVATI